MNEEIDNIRKSVVLINKKSFDAFYENKNIPYEDVTERVHYTNAIIINYLSSIGTCLCFFKEKREEKWPEIEEKYPLLSEIYKYFYNGYKHGFKEEGSSSNRPFGKWFYILLGDNMDQQKEEHKTHNIEIYNNINDSYAQFLDFAEI